MAIVHEKEITIGAGSLFIADLDASGNPLGYRYMGDSEGFTITPSSTQLDVMSGDGQISEKMESVTTAIERAGSCVLNEVTDENLALFLIGKASSLSQAVDAAADQEFTDVVEGYYYSLGATAANPAGHKDVTSVVVATGATTHVEGTDYEVVADTGMVFIIKGGGISTGDDIEVDYAVAAKEYAQIESTESDTGYKAIKYKEDASAGDNRDIYLTKCNVLPEGGMDIKSRDSHQQVTLNIESLVPSGGPAIVMVKRDATA